jgi:hypothetical protein
MLFAELISSCPITLVRRSTTNERAAACLALYGFYQWSGKYGE